MDQNKYQRYLKAFLPKMPAFQAFYRAMEAEGLARFGEIKKPLKILDIGCGDGTFGQVFLGKGHSLAGIDIDRKALVRAGKKRIYSCLIEGEAQKMPFNNGEFDLVLANSSLEHMDGLKKTLAEAVRVLKKGGLLLLTAPSNKRREYFSLYRLTRFFGAKKLARAAGDWQNSLVNHKNCFSDKQWNLFLEKAGFGKIKSYYLVGKKACLLADVLMVFSTPAWLEKKLFGFFLPARINALWLYPVFKNFKDKVPGKNGAVLAVMAIK